MKKLATVAVLCLVATGCGSTMGPNEQGGTIIGGVAGALVGSQFGHGSGRAVGAVIGAGAGALIGNQVGQSMDR